MESAAPTAAVAVAVAAPSNAYSMFQIIGIIVVFTIFASIFAFSKNSLPSWESINMLWGSSDVLPPPESESGKAQSEPAKIDYPNTTTRNPAMETKTDEKPGSDNESSESKFPTLAGKEAKGPSASAEQTWCFVGEDEVGRWCVEVPTAASCDADRTYSSKNGCERQQVN